MDVHLHNFTKKATISKVNDRANVQNKIVLDYIFLRVHVFVYSDLKKRVSYSRIAQHTNIISMYSM